MARTYSHLTIKTLFGEATHCAYPNCPESLIFRDREKATVIAEIAHIRSEVVGGPRYDKTFSGDINGPENLLLLCGKHHRPVDRHEQTYTIEELEEWKLQQRSKSGGGTPLSEADIKRFTGLNPDERAVLMDVARKTQAVIHATQIGVASVVSIQEANERARRHAFAQHGQAWSVDDDNNRTPITHEGFSLANVEQAKWNQLIQNKWANHSSQIESAIANLGMELAVLRMLSATYKDSTQQILDNSAQLKQCAEKPQELPLAIQQLEATVAQLWRIANGESPTPTDTAEGN